MVKCFFSCSNSHNVEDPNKSESLPEQAELIRRLRARLQRENAARKMAESLLEEKSLELFHANTALSETAAQLELRVSERTAELSQAVQQARSANESKSRFLALMSHEIRTPLNGLLGLSEILSSTVLDEQQRVYVKNILSAGNLLLFLINDILDFSKIEAGEMSLEKLAFDPVQVVRKTLDLMQLSVLNKDVSLEFSAAKPLPLQLLNDPTRLHQVLLNLVGNAVKFTKRGKVTVALHADPDKLIFEVKDSGIGMSEAVIAGLFRPFRQADESITRKFGGTGLGLVISKSLIEKMGGQLRITSMEGKGSCFSFALPLTEEMWLQTPKRDWYDAKNTHGEDNISAPATDPAGLRILVVDDQPINRLVALTQLKKLGMLLVDEAENGQKALQALQAKPYDVVLMDVQMPVMDGLDATRALRKLGLEPQPVVLAFTANAFPEDRELCLLAGMNYFLTKPLATRALKEVFHKVLAGEINASTHDGQAIAKG